MASGVALCSFVFYQLEEARPTVKQGGLIVEKFEGGRGGKEVLKYHVKSRCQPFGHRIDQAQKWGALPFGLQEFIKDKYGAAGLEYTHTLLQTSDRIRHDSDDQMQDNVIKAVISQWKFLRVPAEALKTLRGGGGKQLLLRML